ncbi:MAG: BMP family ABC transporter substrate-binding protein [Clostridia bacterium]|nr:BMP family ABC transporter substrate-binding protein [Clostridia bacterium]
MSRIEAIQQYHDALKLGIRYYNARTAARENPYPAVLEDVTSETQASGHASLGTIEIPIENIIGTMAAGRKTAFAGNFMPLLPENSEFAQKWINLCEAHLGADGIHDPITCMEFMGKFYVTEGHKRVSVLKSFGALSIPATVTRIIPVWSDDPAVQAYYEFMHYYRQMGLYQVQFSRPGRYEQLMARLPYPPEHVWTREERADFLSLYRRFERLCREKVLENVPGHSLSEVILSCLEMSSYEELQADDDAAIQKKVTAVLSDLRFAAGEEHARVSIAPETREKGLVRQLLDGISRPTLNIAFIHASDPAVSAWSEGHDEGRKRLEEAFDSQVRVRSYIAGKENADEIMEQAVQEQAQVIFATAPTLLGPARRMAALHPELKVLVCALTVPFTGIRTYYCRIYEAKFISGAIAGAMSQGEPIGYIARYPILGVPAAINAFALGARMTAPDARIKVAWSCLPGDPLEEMRQAGARIVSGHPVASYHPVSPIGWTTSMRQQDGTFIPLASDVWNWGRMYQKIVRSILDGGWDKEDAAPAVNYWWGMNGGVIGLKLADSLPVGVAHLARLLRNGLSVGAIHPFLCPITDQKGRVQSEGDRWFTPAEIMDMNWLCDNVDGRLPRPDEVLDMSRETTGLLAIRPDVGTPEKERDL